MACDLDTKTASWGVLDNMSEVVSEHLIPESPLSPYAQEGLRNIREREREHELDSGGLEAQTWRIPQGSAWTCDLKQDGSRTSEWMRAQRED